MVKAVVIGLYRFQNGGVCGIEVGITVGFVGQVWHFNIDRTIRAAFENKVVKQSIVITARSGSDNEVGVKTLLGKGKHLLPVATAQSLCLSLISSNRREDTGCYRISQLKEIVLADGYTLKEIELQV